MATAASLLPAFDWARAALARLTGNDFKDDKLAWAKWWEAAGHDPIDAVLLQPWQSPAEADK